ncbi:MAG: hypothetical protein QW175_01680 [Candidatus Bathyarchaeia archaeon]
MILGLPEEIFFLLAYSGIATTAAVIFGVLLYILPPTGKLLLKGRLAKKKPKIVFEQCKNYLGAHLTWDYGPGWVQTNDGKKLVVPIPPAKNSSEWSPERDILGKACLLDGMFECYFAYETSAIGLTPEILAHLEAYNKGYEDNKQIQIGNLKVSLPVSPKSISETIQGFLTAEHVDQLEERIIDVEVKRRARGEWGPIIKVVAVIGAVTIFCLVVLLIAKGALGL